MNSLNLNTLIKCNTTLKIIIGIGLFSFLFIVLIKGVIGPMQLNLPKYAIILQGVLPNFFAAIGISAFSFIYFLNLLKNKDNFINISLWVCLGDIQL